MVNSLDRQEIRDERKKMTPKIVIVSYVLRESMIVSM